MYIHIYICICITIDIHTQCIVYDACCNVYMKLTGVLQVSCRWEFGDVIKILLQDIMRLTQASNSYTTERMSGALGRLHDKGPGASMTRDPLT